ncbi:MAG: M23 family metallopeptidase [Mangrovibacterium sp.]
METKKTKKTSRKKHNQYRLVIYDDGNFQVVWNMQFSRALAYRWLAASIIPLIALVVVLIFFTPLRHLVPGYPEPGMRKNLINNAAMIDSLQHELELQHQYLTSIQAVIRGDIPEEEIAEIDTSQFILADLSEYNLNHDSIFQLHLLNDPLENQNIDSYNSSHNERIQNIIFFPPVKGIVTDNFLSNAEHFGVDIVSSPEASIFSILDGTIIQAGFTVETGYVVYIQHDYNIVSVYKHNQQLLKKTGDKVRAGDAIAIIGNTGELTTGPHLHFELWFRGQPINPTEFIRFN